MKRFCLIALASVFGISSLISSQAFAQITQTYPQHSYGLPYTGNPYTGPDPARRALQSDIARENMERQQLQNAIRQQQEAARQQRQFELQQQKAQQEKAIAAIQKQCNSTNLNSADFATRSKCQNIQFHQQFGTGLNKKYLPKPKNQYDLGN